MHRQLTDEVIKQMRLGRNRARRLLSFAWRRGQSQSTRQALVLGAAGLLAAATIAVAVVAAVRDGGSGGGGGCDRPLCVAVLSPADDVDPMTPVRVRLAGKLDREAVLRQLKISNDPAGVPRFDGDVLTFRPQWPGFARGTTYDVSLDLSSTQVPAGADPVQLRYRFTTTGKLKVSSVFPADGAKEIALDAPLMVQFSRAVAPLTVVDGPGPQAIIEFTPAVPGDGLWLNTSLYTFRPKPGWAPATTYSARINAGLTNDLGARLDNDYAFSFSTLSPAVSTFAPADQSTFVAPRPDIRVVFNQPVDRPSAESRFSVAPAGGEAVPGTYEWPDDLTMIFRPASPLALGTRFLAVQRAGANAPGSAVKIETEQRWTFDTVGAPTVLLTAPANGEQRADRFGLTITFSNPMDEKSVEDRVTITPKPAGTPYYNWDPDGRTLRVGVALESSSAYTFALTADAMDRYGQRLSGALSVSFVTDRLQPGFGIFRSSGSGTFNAYLDPTIIATSWNLEQLDFELYSIDRATLIQYEQGKFGGESPPGRTPIRTWSERIGSAPVDTRVATTTRVAGTAPLPQGVYYLRLTAPGVSGADGIPFVISSANIVTKWSRNELLVWAVDLKSGAPLASLPLNIHSGDDSLIATGTTGDDGVTRIAIPGVSGGNYYPGYYVSSERDGFVAMAGTFWSGGIGRLDNDISFQFQTPSFVGHLYTDRPIYRPGETVNFKGIARADNDAHYALPPADTAMRLVIRDANSKPIFDEPVGLSDLGTVQGRLALAGDAMTGVYYASLEQRVSSSPPMFGSQIASVAFRVAEFRKPEFEVAVASGRPSYINGQTVTGTVDASLFFGAPLANASVKWQVTSQGYTFRAEDFARYSFSDYDESRYYAEGPYYEQQQRVRAQGEAKTDAGGKFSFQLPADLSADPSSQTFRLEATITDENGQQTSASTDVPVHKGDFYIGMKADEYVAVAGERTQIELVTLDTDGNAAANIPVAVNVYERTWRTVRERDTDGQQRYLSEHDDKLVETVSATTGADAKGQFTFTPKKSGEYYLVATSKDARGNEVKSSTFVWASGGEYASWRVSNDDVIQLVADKDEYAPGDTAKILVTAPFLASQGLVTQERGGVLRYDLRSFPTNSEVIEVPITDDHIPNVYVSVALFKAPTATNPMPQAKFGTVNLKVSTERKKLNIAIKPDRERLGPRDTVTYSITTTDSDGNPAPAELSLALVDKSVLSLQDDFARASTDAFWFKRSLGVMTASTFAVSIDRANELNIDRLKQGGKGGGGAPGDETRTFFPNTAYWEPALRTDANGKASVQVKLPDTLTTWRLTARGVTADTKVGEARNDIITAKDVIVRPAVTRFLVSDDHAFLGAIVHNFGKQAQDFDVALKAEGVTIDGDAVQRVRIEAGGEAVVRWSTRAKPGVKKAALDFEARTDGASDSVHIELPVYAFVTPETAATAGQAGDDAEASEAIEVPYYVRPDAGELTVNVSPSLVASVNTSLAYLDEYPYESAESIVSRFVPRLALNRAVSQLGLKDIDNGGGDTGALVQRSIRKLYAAQTKEGGWGWWPGEAADPAMTAYVLIGLAEAKRSGYDVDSIVEQNAAAYLRSQLDLPRDVVDPAFNQRAYYEFALAMSGRGELGRAYALAERSSELSNTAKAWTAIAIKLSGGMYVDPRVTNLLSQLQGAAITSATGSHWEESKYDYSTFSNSTQATAQVLEALTLLDPGNPLVDSTLRWLMVARKADGNWESTHDTAVALLAITNFMLVRQEGQYSFDYSVELNGDERLSGKAVAGKLRDEQTLVIQMKELLKDTANELKVTRTSGDAGRLYYTARLRYYTPAENVEAATRGIGVSHQYLRADAQGDVPVRAAQLGDTIKVKVTLVAESDLNYVVLEDYLPAGLEPIDASLKTSPPDLQRRLIDEQRLSYRVGRYSPFGHTDVRDNRVALFARFVPKGVYEYTYFAQATTPGEFKLPPATAYEQYFPEVWGRSDGGTFTVTAGTASAPTSGTGARVDGASSSLELAVDAVLPKRNLSATARLAVRSREA